MTKITIFLVVVFGITLSTLCFAAGAVDVFPSGSNVSVDIRGGDGAGEIFEILMNGGAPRIAPGVEAYGTESLQAGLIHDFNYRVSASFLIDASSQYQIQKTATEAGVTFTGAVAKTLYDYMEKAGTYSHATAHHLKGQTTDCNEPTELSKDYRCAVSVVF